MVCAGFAAAGGSGCVGLLLRSTSAGFAWDAPVGGAVSLAMLTPSPAISHKKFVSIFQLIFIISLITVAK